MKVKNRFLKRMLPVFLVVLMTVTGIPADIVSQVTGSDVTGVTTVLAAGDTNTATYVKDADVAPKVTSDLAEGTVFETENKEITLTLENADKGTYCVDDGSVKEFTDSAKVVIGQGKIADTTVTVKATATKGTTTKEFTFTYQKKFKDTIHEAEDLSAVNVASEALASETDESALTTLASNYYVTNPNGTGKSATITIDGNFSDWSEDMLIAQGAAWDVANHYKGGHENCVLDTYSLYAAWDNDNLYIAWQMVNTTDTWAREGDGPLSDGGRILDVPLILALSLDESSISMSNKNTSGGSIWGQKMGITFDTHVDRLLYMSGKPGLGTPAMFKAVDSQGNTDYSDGIVTFRSGGIEYKMAEGNVSSKIWGLNYSETPSDVCSNNADWVDYKTFIGSSGAHDTKYDSFYEIKIPLATLGITKSDIESKGIGAMVIATRGESGLDCIPFDTTMLDHATESNVADPSTSYEKDDEDVITVPFARIGHDIITPPPAEELKLNFGADRSAPQVESTELTLKGIAQGGTLPYTYEFTVNGEKITGTGDSVSWTPSTAGQYVIACTATDADGNTEISSKYYTVEKTGDYPPVCTHTNIEVRNAKAATCTETGNIEYWQCKDCGDLFSDPDGKNKIKLENTVTAKLPPEIIEGKGQSVAEGEKTELSFKSNAAFSDFIRVEIDGKTLDEKNYTKKEGSIIVTLKADYVATLAVGKHTIGIVSESGTATTTFTVNSKATVNDDSKSPQTGDNSHRALWIALLFVSGGLLAAMGIYGKKKKYNR